VVSSRCHIYVTFIHCPRVMAWHKLKETIA
jgi:hypothetical protein